VTDLKTRIARGEYQVDSRAVAEEIIAKMRIVSRVHAQLTEGTSVASPKRRFAPTSSWSRTHRRAAF
jgi:hypothetical protein